MAPAVSPLSSASRDGVMSGSDATRFEAAQVAGTQSQLRRDGLVCGDRLVDEQTDRLRRLTA